jgi:hypothetical protein
MILKFLPLAQSTLRSVSIRLDGMTVLRATDTLSANRKFEPSFRPMTSPSKSLLPLQL